MEVSQLKMLKELQEVKLRLKCMYPELSLDNRILKRCYREKALRSSQKKKVAKEIVVEEKASIGKACKLIGLPSFVYYYNVVKDDIPL
jgi:hypothetical protein